MATSADLQVQMQNISAGRILRDADGVGRFKCSDIARGLVVIKDRFVVQAQRISPQSEFDSTTVANEVTGLSDRIK